MSHFAYTRPGGTWSAFSALFSADMASLDQKTFKSINGDDGGTWAPSSPITIGGSGINITGLASIAHNAVIGTTGADILQVISTSVFVNGLSSSVDIQASRDVTAGRNLFVTGFITGNNGISITGSCAFQSTTVTSLATSGNAFISGTFHSAGAAQFDSGVTTSSLVVSGATTLSGALSATSISASGAVVAAGGTLSAPLFYTSTGRPVRTPVIGATSGGGTLDPAVGSIYFFASGMSSQTYALATVGVQNGDTIEVALQTGTSGTLTVTGALGGSISMRHYSAGDVWGVKLVYIGSLSAWAPISVSAYP